MTLEHFQKIGEDMCRAILIHQGIYVPPELEHLYPKSEEGKPVDFAKALATEILENKQLLDSGDGDSSDGGSDSEPSDDNLPLEE